MFHWVSYLAERGLSFVCWRRLSVVSTQQSNDTVFHFSVSRNVDILVLLAYYQLSAAR